MMLTFVVTERWRRRESHDKDATSQEKQENARQEIPIHGHPLDNDFDR